MNTEKRLRPAARGLMPFITLMSRIPRPPVRSRDYRRGSVTWLRTLYQGDILLISTNNVAEMETRARLIAQGYAEPGYQNYIKLTPKGVRYCEARLSGPWGFVRSEVTFDRAMLFIIAAGTVAGIIVSLNR